MDHAAESRTARLGRVALGLGAEVGCTRSASSALLLLLSWAGIRSQGTGKHPGVTAKDVKNLGPRTCGVTKGILDCSFLHCRMGEKPAFLLRLLVWTNSQADEGHQGEATLCLLYFVNKSRKY